METFIPDKSNKLFQLAADLINQSNRNIFLTGKAGTGKTTFLKYIRESCSKQMAIVAPTGVAAINAGGVTIHSFFQLPLTLFIPEASGFRGNDETVNRHTLLSRLKMNNDKKKLLQELELLVIDEISMVRCDTLDAIDVVLRHIRHRPNELFGGVQLLFIGDLFQLPPVIINDEWNILSAYYDSPFFFSSHALRELPPLYVEFEKIYRQSDEQFIHVLNQVRNNILDQHGLEILEKRFDPSFHPKKEEGYVILTTHNNRAEIINNNELQKLGEKAISFKATKEGEFPDKAYPADEILWLKKGAQVMFIKNDSAKLKRYYNGKIGIVTGITDEEIIVECKDEPDKIEVKKETWENIRYAIDKKTRAVESNVIGSFTQYPLRLAWAITIHKSQGLTFDKAIIDAGEAFAAGQVYVALSRCTNLGGMVLKSRIRLDSLNSDPRVIKFSKTNGSSDNLQRELAVSTILYRQSILLQLFDFTTSLTAGKELTQYLSEHTASFNEEALTWCNELTEKIKTQQETSSKFQSHLLRFFESSELIENNDLFRQRLSAAIIHFRNELNTILEIIQKSSVITDSRMHAKEFNDIIRELFSQLSLKKFLLKGCDDILNIRVYQQNKRAFVTPPFSVNAYAGASSKQDDDIAHPLLHQHLRKLRDGICAQKNLPIYIVAGTTTLNELANYLPQTLQELRQISGFGDAKIEKYGRQFLDVVLRYCTERNLESRMQFKNPKREQKKDSKMDTRVESFRLFKKGNSIENIAIARNRSVSTIETHLAHFVETGEIKIEELLPKEKLLAIQPLIKELGTETLSPLKEKVGEEISYGDLRFAVAWYKYEQGNEVSG